MTVSGTGTAAQQLGGVHWALIVKENRMWEVLAGGAIAKGFGALAGGSLLKKVYDDKKNEKDNFSLDDEFGDCEVSYTSHC